MEENHGLNVMVVPSDFSSSSISSVNKPVISPCIRYPDLTSTTTNYPRVSNHEKYTQKALTKSGSYFAAQTSILIAMGPPVKAGVPEIIPIPILHESTSPRPSLHPACKPLRSRILRSAGDSAPGSHKKFLLKFSTKPVTTRTRDEFRRAPFYHFLRSLVSRA